MIVLDYNTRVAPFPGAWIEIFWKSILQADPGGRSLPGSVD